MVIRLDKKHSESQFNLLTMSNPTDSQTFCPHMWLSATHSNGGFFKPCCVYDSNNHENKWGLGFTNNQRYLDAQRKKLANNEKPSECGRCFYYEEKGIKSLRTDTLDFDWWKPYADHINENTDMATGRYERDPVYFDLKLGNKCNLACRMCSPSDSSLIEKEIRKDPTLFDYNPVYKQDIDFINQHYTDDRKIDMVFDAISNVEQLVELKFTGGEPFLNQRIPQFIDQCIDKGIADKIKIHFTSNLTTLPDKILDKLSKFKYSNINVSMEGIESTYEYIRYPASWDKFSKNFDKLISSGVNYSVTYTANNLSVVDMHRWLDWITKKEVNWTANPVIDPSYYHVRILPLELKQEVNYHCRNMPLDIHTRSKVAGILNMMDQPSDAQIWETFCKETKIKDKIRSQSIAKSIPLLGGFVAG